MQLYDRYYRQFADNVEGCKAMTLMKRIMWPKRGEEVTIFRDGEIIAEGHVIYSGMDSVTILNREAISRTISGKELSEGIDTGRIVVKKKGWSARDGR